MSRKTTQQLTHAISCLRVIELLESGEDSTEARDIIREMGAPTVAVTAMALVRAILGYWADAMKAEPMDLLAMVRQDLEWKRD